jgi:hypothetical protein
MKKHFLSLLLAVLVSVGIVTAGTQVQAVTSVPVQPTTISQLVELLISIGVIAPDKAVSARAAAVNLGKVAASNAIVSASTVSTSTAYIQVLKPNGGESWEIDLDVPYQISWGSSGLSHVRIALVDSKNVPCEISLSPFTSKDGDHNKDLLLKNALCYNLNTGSSTPLKDGTYKVRVYFTDARGVTVKDESNSTFRILPVPIPSIKVTYPNGGESLVRNTDYDIKYSLTNVDDSIDGLIYMYLLDNNGNIAFNSHKLMRNGLYDLEFPGSLSAGAYKVKLKLTTKDERVEIEDTSDNFFWVSTGL